jgi:hypothetical protein
MSPTNDEQIFLNALRALHVSSDEAMALSLESGPQNPCKFLELANATPEDKWAFGRLFDLLLARGGIHWGNLRRFLSELAVEIRVQESDRWGGFM